MTRVLSGASDVDGNHVLPLREQAVVRDSWLTERLRTVLPVIMRGNNIDVWLVIAREYNEDPVLPSLLPAEWLSARRRTILALRCTESGIDARSLTKYPVAAFAPAWVDPEQSQYDTLAALLREWDPARIGVDLSETFGLADGLAHTEHELLGQALGDLAERLVSAEDVAIGWLETRLPEEIAVAHGLNRLAHNVIDEAFSADIVHVGTTTAADVAWWFRQRFHDLGVDPWFQPTVGIQRRGVPQFEPHDGRNDSLPADTVIAHGDLLHCDVGLRSLGLHTDTQRNAYVRHPGESGAPEGLRTALHIGNRMQDLTTAAFVLGRTGNEILSAARAGGAAEDIDGDIYSHPVGVHGHAAGPTIGLWDSQDGVPGSGDYPLHDNTIYALELCVRTPVADWDGQVVRMALEQGIAVADGTVSYLDARQTELILI